MDNTAKELGPITVEYYLEMVADLNRHNFLYHEKHAPEISDEEYDQRYKKLLKLETECPSWISSDSPTQRVGQTPSSTFRKYRHPVRMYSLENTFDANELRKFSKRFAELRRKFSAAEIDQFYVDCKMDGLAVDLIYRDGKLILGLTRGDGTYGEDVTANILTIPNIPKRIRTKRTVLVHGEVVVHRADFHAANREREAKGLKLFATTRNYAAGSLRQTDPEVTRKRLLRFYGWHLSAIDRPKLTQEDQARILTELGFNVPVGRMCYSIEEIISFINEIARIRHELPYDIDGAVVKQNHPEYQHALGFNNHAPLWATAWKFTAEGAGTEIYRIRWNMGRTGRLTPVARVASVIIGGVEISDVNLHNAGYVEESRIGPGAKIRVIRSGDVIPKVAEIITKGTYLGPPTECPYCSQPTAKFNGELRCINPKCQEILIAALCYLVGKDVLDIRGIGESFVREAVTSGTISSLKDIFAPLENKSSNLSQDMLDGLVTRVRNINMVELLMILGINGIGRAIAGKIVMEVINIGGLIRLMEDSEQMRLLPIGDSIKNNMTLWYSKLENKQLLATIRDSHLVYCD